MQNLFTYSNICLHIAYEHIHLTPGTSCSVMNVRVATQNLSTIFSEVLCNCLPANTTDAANFL